MFTIVVYHLETKKIIAALPFIFDGPTHIVQNPGILHNDYGYRVFCDMEPVLYEDEDGDLCIQDNALIINSNILLGDDHRDLGGGLDHTF